MVKMNLPWKNIHVGLIAALCALLVGMGCGQAQRREAVRYTSPAGYDLNNPEVFEMQDVLEEISGITFFEGNPDTLFAQQDEEGKLFFFALENEKPKQTRFGNDGDYEDIAIFNRDVIVLRSDGSLYRFPLEERHGKRVESVTTWKKPFPKGEYESLAAHAGDNQLYIFCKECEIDRKQGATTGYRFRLAEDGTLSELFSFSVSHAQIEHHVSLDGKPFRPSAMAWNPHTHEWYVISSINKMLIVLDERWQVRGAYPLDPDRYVQPEGLAFDNNRALYIASERGKKGKWGAVYKFPFNE